MTDWGWRLVEGTASWLEEPEREAVLGDLAESGEAAWRGVAAVMGLAMRRQAELWANWRPWLAVFGVALPSSFQLMGFSLLVSRMAGQLLGAERPGGTELGLLVCRVVLLLCWAWSGGFVVGSLSRRTLWASATACLVPCLFCLSRFAVPGMSRVSLLLFAVPAVFGVWSGLRRRRLRAGQALVLALLVTWLMLPGWSGSWLYALWLLWPAWFLVGTARPAVVKA